MLILECWALPNCTLLVNVLWKLLNVKPFLTLLSLLKFMAGEIPWREWTRIAASSNLNPSASCAPLLLMAFCGWGQTSAGQFAVWTEATSYFAQEASCDEITGSQCSCASRSCGNPACFVNFTLSILDYGSCSDYKALCVWMHAMSQSQSRTWSSSYEPSSWCTNWTRAVSLLCLWGGPFWKFFRESGP